MFLTADADCIPATEAHSQRLIATWLDRAGLPTDGTAWPLSLEDAAQLLTEGGEYSISPDQLRELGERGQVPRIESWDAKDVMSAACALEARRQWKPVPSTHDPKKPNEWQAYETNLTNGPEGIRAMRHQLKAFDLRTAMTLLVEADNRHMRERLFATVAAILAADHEVIL